MACIHLQLTTCILRIVMFLTITLDIEIILIFPLHIVTCMPKVFFYYSSILIWNEIRNNIEVSDSFPQFKILLKHYLLVNGLIQDSDEIINGRPYGGLAILIRKQYRPICDFQSFDDSMLLSVTISSSVEKHCFINVYMPYQHDDNYETFMECIGKLSATIEDSDMYNFIILGDFNSTVDTPFESELLEFCSAYELTISDYQRYGRG